MDIYNEYLQLARLATSGRRDDITTILRRTLKRSGKERPEFASRLKDLLNNTEGSILRKTSPINSSQDSLTEPFLKSKKINNDISPIWFGDVLSGLNDIVKEQHNVELLKSANIHPTRSVLFTGPPGAGKTLAAHWLEKQLNRQLLTLDLASIMSSYLGRTGANLSKVLADSAHENAILFLDEFDSIGKKRDDLSDVGELKRLVNVLLQSLDNWPGNGLLIAATNHPELLDKAVWRRFDKIITFTTPSAEDQTRFINQKLSKLSFDIEPDLIKLIGLIFNHVSFAESELWFNSCLRRSLINDESFEDVLITESTKRMTRFSVDQKTDVARALIKLGLSQRKAAELLQISRDTIRKYSK